MMPNNERGQVGIWLTSAEVADFDRPFHNHLDPETEERDLLQRVVPDEDDLFYADEDTAQALLRALTAEIEVQKVAFQLFSPSRWQQIRAALPYPRRSAREKAMLAYELAAERANVYADNAERYTLAASRLCRLLQEQRTGRDIYGAAKVDRVRVYEDSQRETA